MTGNGSPQPSVSYYARKDHMPPAVSAQQQRFMGWLQKHPAERKKRGISLKVAKEFSHKPKGGYTKKRKRRM